MPLTNRPAEVPLTAPLSKVLRTVVPACAAIFIADLWIEHSIAFGLLYIIPVLLSPWGGSRRFTTGVATVCTLLTLISLWTPVAIAAEGAGPGISRQDLAIPFVNAAMAIFAIWVTANLSLFRVTVEKKLNTDRETVRTTLSSIADAVITTDENGRLTFMNRAAEELCGSSAHEVTGRPVEEVFRFKRERDVDTDSAAFEIPAAPNGALSTVLMTEGMEIPIDQSVAPIRDAEGRFRGRVLVFRNATERWKYEREIKRLAFRDPLTGLPNRASLWDRLGLEVAHARREGVLLALLFLDLDGFKEINDTLGHKAGDEVLCAAARLLRDSLREGDTVARLGGDEFTVLLPALAHADDAALVARKILAICEKPLLVPSAKSELRVRPSIGIAIFPTDAEDADTLLQRADEAMYRTKERGGSSWSFYSREVKAV